MCNSCGANIEFNTNERLINCIYCGSSIMLMENELENLNITKVIPFNISENEIKKKLSYLNYERIKNTNNEQLSNTIEIIDEISNEQIDISEIILNECIKNLIEEKNIKENDIVNIENDLSIIDNIYIPFYPGKITIENSSNLNYQIAISNPQQIIETITENYTIIDDKPRCKRYRFIAGRCFIMFFC